MRTAFTIDGRAFNVIVKSIKRSAQVMDTENTIRLLNGDMFREVLGTYYNYSVEIDAKNLNENEYDDLYEIITSPEPFHDVIMPYGQAILAFKAYCSSAQDELISISQKRNRWGNLQFNFIAKAPARVPS